MKVTRQTLPESGPCRQPTARVRTWSNTQLITFLSGVLLAVAPLSLAQAPTPLNFANNFFVTGDYVVAGAYNMNSKFTTINGVSYALGTINVPDTRNLGIQGVTSVPPGGQVVAALLYWQTAEKLGVTAGGNGSGQNGFFRPLLYSASGGPAVPGYAIQGTSVTGSTAVSWSSGGCSGTSTGKVLKTYRADVAGALPVDGNGNPIANGSFEVRLQSTGNGTPITLGATLVIIYRIPAGAGGPNIPLNSIVIYDGDYAQNNAMLTMTQKLQGFYDADQNPVSRLTHIVGSGQSNKFQTVYLSTEKATSLVALPFLYGNKLPAFPGWYGTWDNPTWTFSNPTGNSLGMREDDSFATTQVKPAMSNAGCVSWGAVIVSTTVKNTDGDGILNSWKNDHRGSGYCDASINNGSCNGPGDPAWVDLTGATTGHKDIFLQYDYMCSSVQGPASSPNSCSTTNGDYSFDPRLAVDPTGESAVEKVVAAFTNQTGSPKTFALHAIPGNAIAESQSSCAASDIDPVTKNLTCPFPGEPGTVGFREGLAYIKNQNIDPSTGTLCMPGAAGCGPVAVFQHGKKDSYHYTMFSHGVGLPSWFLSDPTTLTSVKQFGSTPTQPGNTVTFTTPSPNGITQILSQAKGGSALADDSCKLGRVTVAYAITNPSLEGTFCVKSVTTVPPYTFTITIGGSPMNFTYTAHTDPNLAIADGQVTSMSGFSDVGGQNSIVSLGYGFWGPPNVATSDGNTWQVKAGTFMHELGHTLGLTHGGTFYSKLGSKDYTPTFEPNCKPNLQSIMNYQFQVDLLEDPATGKQVLDYSKEALTSLTESSPQPQQPGILSNAAYANTAWFQLTSFVKGLNPNLTPKVMQVHCDGTPLLPGDQPTTYASGATNSFFWSNANTPGITGNDINFDGSSAETLHGHNEWDGTVVAGVNPSPAVDLQQISAVGTISAIGLGGEAGALHPAGGGGALHPAGGGGALHPAGGGGALHPAGGGGLKGDITHQNANSYTRPPRSLTATEDVSPRTITLNWTQPTFGQIVQYNVYRAIGSGQFQFLNSVVPVAPAIAFPPTTYHDNASCNLSGYTYEVTTVVIDDVTLQPQESLPSNSVPGANQDKLTGCYSEPFNLAAPVGAVQGSIVPITWTLTDDFYTLSGPVNRQAANTSLVVNGPLPNNCTVAGATTILLNGAAQGGAGTFTNSGSQYTFNWDSDAFCAGSYTFKLTLDSTQTQTTTIPTKLDIDINDTDSTPHITTLSVPDATIDVGYSSPLSEEGGVGSVTWSLTSGSLPPGVTLSAAGVLVGTPIVPPPGQLNFVSQLYNFTAKVTDSVGNIGTQAFTLNLIAPVSLSRTDYTIGTKPVGVIAASFTTSGHLDLAIANSGDGTVSILTGNGNGTFTAQATLTAGSLPWSLASADFNGDGLTDLVVTSFGNGSGNTVSVFLGNGNGTFQTTAPISVGNGPISVISGNFNGDGFLDLAVANQNDDSVSILLGNGDGTFQPQTAYQVGTIDVGGLALGDFNHDGSVDLAVTNPSNNTVSVLLGNGNGTFTSPLPYATGNPGDSVAVTAFDFDGDGELDLAVANRNGNTVTILIGNGDGSFKAPVSYPATINGVFHGPVAITTADFNGDGNIDLAIAEQGINTVSILLGNGDATFQSPLEFTTGALATGVATGDFNGDGRLDLAVADFTGNSVSVMLHLPQPPTNLAVNSTTATSVTLGWTGSANVTGYNVYRSNAPAGPYINPTFVGSTGYTDTGVTHGNTYYYVVTAVGSFSQESVKSVVVSAAP